jgi:hypothetical protein
VTAIPIHDVTSPQAERAPHYDAPYRNFIFASLIIGLGGGFVLALLLPLARTLDWSWGATERWQVMLQLHGQLLLIGFGGLFVMGMALRITPRVSARQLALQPLIAALIPTIAGYVLLRSAAQPLADGLARNVGLAASALLYVAGASVFAAVIWGTLLSRKSKAEAAGWFFVLGALALVATSLINAIQTSQMIDESLAVAPATRQTALIFTQQFGFLIMFIGGVGSRAIPGLTGQPRRQIVPRVAAIVFAGGVVLFSALLIVMADHRPSDVMIRVGVTGLLLTGTGLIMFVWISGALMPASRVAPASKLQFWFVRSAFAWMTVAAALIFWYGLDALTEATVPDQFALDAIRHVLTVGVLVNIIIGMSMLIVPEFAGRRLQHPNERLLVLTLLGATNVASALRLWPALEGIDWLEDSRYWPIATAGLLGIAAVGLFGSLFVQSWWEQRDPAWTRHATEQRHPDTS